LIDSGLSKLNNIFIPLYSEKDCFLIELARNFIKNLGSKVLILDILGQINKYTKIKNQINDIEKSLSTKVDVINIYSEKKEFYYYQNLMLISMENCKKFESVKNNWISDNYSSLIIINVENENIEFNH